QRRSWPGTAAVQFRDPMSEPTGRRYLKGSSSRHEQVNFSTHPCARSDIELCTDPRRPLTQSGQAEMPLPPGIQDLRINSLTVIANQQANVIRTVLEDRLHR